MKLLPSGLSVCLIVSTLATGVNFLQSGLVSESDAKASLSSELATSDTSVAGQRLREIQDSMQTMYTSLPKNAEGRLSHQAVRYALHRFLVHQNGWFIRGLEPNNDTWHGAVDPDLHNSSHMKEWVPSFLQDVLEQRLRQGGTDLVQLSALAAALEDLIQQEAYGRLESMYDMYEYPRGKELTRVEVDELITTYYVAFLNSGDFIANSREDALRNTKEYIADYAGWPQAEMWLEELSAKYLDSGSSTKFALTSLSLLVNKIGEEYYAFNDKECDDLKTTLKAMQGKKPGRVRLSTFYNKGMYSHWDFSEKKDYLRSLGVLDETNPEHPSVIIANYAMARPNCLDSSNIYTICCRNECEDLMGELESKIGSATAQPEQIITIVSTLSSATVSAPRIIPSSLVDRLRDIATRHAGSVPLHGRLFAQWMHHTFPLECPYPQELGTVNPLTRGEWIKETGQGSEKASTEEMLEHIAADSCAVNPEGGVRCSEESADIPWSSNEELLSWHSPDALVRVSRSATTQPQTSSMGWCLACVLVVVILMVAYRFSQQRASAEGDEEAGRVQQPVKVARRNVCTLGLVSLAAYMVGLLDGYLFVCVMVCGFVVLVAEQVTVRINKRSNPKAV